MTSVEVKGHCDDDNLTNDLSQSGVLTSGKLLMRPQTASPTLRKSSLQRSNSSLAIIGTERAIVEKDDTRKRSQDLVSSASVSRKKTLDSLKSTKLKGLQFRVKSAVSRTGEIGGVEQQNIPVIGKELLLTKSLSSPNFTQDNNLMTLVKDTNAENKQSAIVFPKRNSKKSGLFVSTEPITLVTRPSSSLSISRKLRQERPKTTSSLAHSLRCKASEDEDKNKQKDNASTVYASGTCTEIQNGNETVDSNRISNEDKSHNLTTGVKDSSVKGEEHQSDNTENNNNELRLKLNSDLLERDRKISPLSNRTTDILYCVSSPNDRNINDLESAKDTENIYENIKSILRSRHENKSARSNRSSLSTSLNRVLTPERDLPPVRSPSLVSSNKDQYNIVSQRSASGRSQHSADTKQYSDRLITEWKPDSSVNDSENKNHPDSPKTYKMATVEMYEKDVVKQPRLSIAEEIKKQNVRLEEKNSELRVRENTTVDKYVASNGIEHKSGQLNGSEKGNVCGSPGFKYFQEQLKSMSNSGTHAGPRKLGSGHRITEELSRKSSGKKSGNEKVGLEFKSLGIRPLSDYMRKSPLDNLYVAGGACTYKSGEQAVSKAAEGIATSAGVLSKVSLQHQGSAKLDTSENLACNENGVKVRVSLTYLKEKQGLNPLGYRYRLDDYLSTGNTENKSNLASEEKLGSHKSENKCPKPSCQAVSDSHRSSVPDVYNDDVNGEPGDDDSSSLSSSSSTPTAAFSGSELLYPSDGVHRSQAEELAGSDMPGYERDRQKLRDLEVGNRRPASRSKKMSMVDKVGFDRERDDLRTLNNSLPSKTPALRNGGPRNSLVRGEQISTGRNAGVANSNGEPNDLIAMGTIWSPATNNNNNNSGGNSAVQTRSSSNTTTSNKSIPLNNNIIGSNGFPPRKPASVSMTVSARVGHYGTGVGVGNGTGRTQGMQKDSNKEVEPKYSDPLAGAPASFQQRLMDLASLEAETIRWERTKKVKKKPKQDRDS